MLSTCKHNKVGVYNCNRQARAICNGKLYSFSVVLGQKVWILTACSASQTGNVMRLIFVWSMEKHLMMEEWRYVWMEGGARCALTDGTSEKLKLCVDN